MKKPGSMKALEDMGRCGFRRISSSAISCIRRSPISIAFRIFPTIRISRRGRQAAVRGAAGAVAGDLRRLHIRSGYRSAAVNEFGNRNKLNCSTNAATAADHIWDMRDFDGCMGATACVVVPWMVDHYSNEEDWQKLAWWIHDHLPYAALCFFPKLWAFNIQWHERPKRVIQSYIQPRGILTKPGMANWEGDHAKFYEGFPQLRS